MRRSTRSYSYPTINSRRMALKMWVESNGKTWRNYRGSPTLTLVKSKRASGRRRHWMLSLMWSGRKLLAFVSRLRSRRGRALTAWLTRTRPSYPIKSHRGWRSSRAYWCSRRTFGTRKMLRHSRSATWRKRTNSTVSISWRSTSWDSTKNVMWARSRIERGRWRKSSPGFKICAKKYRSWKNSNLSWTTR